MNQNRCERMGSFHFVLVIQTKKLKFYQELSDDKNVRDIFESVDSSGCGLYLTKAFYLTIFTTT